MSRRIVTAGQGFTDIDAYASAIAYAQLKRLEGVVAEVVLPGPLNVSVPPQLRPEQLDYEVEYVPRDGDTFVVLDVSEPDHIATFVRPEGIEIIIDHHFGYEDYWRERGVQAQIEHIGAVCTQVFELWEQAGRVAEMPQRTAMLLAAGILDNTLNFSSAVTEPRDHHAYGQLLLRAGLDESFSQVYFEACQKDAERDIKDAIMGDSKKVMIPGFVGRVIVGQLALWDVRSAFDVAKELCDEWSDKSQLHMVNLIAINERKSYIVTCDTRMRKFLEGILDIQLTGVVTATDRLWLRKEILKAAMDRSGEELS